MFESVIEKFGKYWDEMNIKKPEKFNQDLAAEVEKRLKQMDYLYKFIMEKHSEYWRLHRRDNKDFILAKDMGKGSSFITKPISEEQLEMNKLSFEMELLTESFYYLAHRTKKIIQNNNDLYSFEGLKSFESKGVRDVRNQLIEHPEKVKDGRIFFPKFWYGWRSRTEFKAYRNRRTRREVSRCRT